jgi:hypothetical protein
MVIGLVFGLLGTAFPAEELPFPAAIDVLALDAETPCPDVPASHIPAVLRTNVGAAFHRGDGTYAWGCPSLWADDLDADLAATPDRGQVLAVTSAGEAYLSANGGCTTTPIGLPEGQLAVDVAWWRNQFFVLTATEGDDVGGKVMYWNGEQLAPLLEWSDFEPYAMLPAGGETLWVTSVIRVDAGTGDLRRGARIRRVTLQGGLSGFDRDVEPLPGEFLDVERVEPRAADADEAWFVLVRGQQQWTWHATVVEGDATTVPVLTEPVQDPRPRFVFGPVKTEGAWVAVMDNEIHTSSQLSRAWVAAGVEVPWSCLVQTGERVFACTPRALLAVTGFEGRGEPATVEVFTFRQVEADFGSCDGEGCEALFTDVRRRAQIPGDAEVASCPDGRTLAELTVSECTCATGGAGGAAGATAALAAALRRRRRRTPPTDHGLLGRNT